jgi:hypothetical protein
MGDPVAAWWTGLALAAQKEDCRLCGLRRNLISWYQKTAAVMGFCSGTALPV